MDPLEIAEVLESFRVIVDTREQNTGKARKRLKAIEVPIERATLQYGDYCWNADIDGKAVHNIVSALTAPCVIERKMSLDELAGNFTRGRARFKREFERAKEQSAKIYLLVENGSWESIMMHRYRSKYHPKAFLASITAWMARYDMVPVFCKSETSGDMIREILYRDLKERLEQGEYG